MYFKTKSITEDKKRSLYGDKGNNKRKYGSWTYIHLIYDTHTHTYIYTHTYTYIYTHTKGESKNNITIGDFDTSVTSIDKSSRKQTKK